MAFIITIADFVGRYKVAKTTYNPATLQDYIERFEPLALANLLGAEMAIAFLNDIPSDGGPPDDPLFTTIYNALQFQSECGVLYYSGGLKSYILGIVYWHYLIEARLTPSITAGAVQNANENSQPVESRNELNLRYNASISYGQAIQKWCCDHKDDYPTFKGVRLLLNWPV